MQVDGGRTLACGFIRLDLPPKSPVIGFPRTPCVLTTSFGLSGGLIKFSLICSQDFHQFNRYLRA